MLIGSSPFGNAPSSPILNIALLVKHTKLNRGFCRLLETLLMSVIDNNFFYELLSALDLFM